MSNGSDSAEKLTSAASGRELALAAFMGGLRECSAASAFVRHVHYERGVLRVREDLYDLRAYRRVFVASFGKAAHTMVSAFAALLGEGLPIEGIVCAPTPPVTPLCNFCYFIGGHPKPNADSLRAASALLRELETLGKEDLAVFLISGGGSSLLELPSDERITLDNLRAAYNVLVCSGATIAEINALRKHLSAVKGGRLAAAAYPARQLSIFFSDVPEGELNTLASGPTMPDTSSLYDCRGILERYKLLPELPPAVASLFINDSLAETPKSDEHYFVGARWWTLLSNAELCAAAAASLREAGLHVEIDCRCDEWEYRDASEYLLDRLRELRERHGKPCTIVSGGEIGVRVEGTGGVGGRNQHFALECARRIEGETITVLSAGSDGADGNSPAAGAIADGTTLHRARTLRLEAGLFLASFDSYSFFHALGDAVETGPTGNNLRDLRILIAC